MNRNNEECRKAGKRHLCRAKIAMDAKGLNHAPFLPSIQSLSQSQILASSQASELLGPTAGRAAPNTSSTFSIPQRSSCQSVVQSLLVSGISPFSADCDSTLLLTCREGKEISKSIRSPCLPHSFNLRKSAESVDKTSRSVSFCRWIYPITPIAATATAANW